MRMVISGRRRVQEIFGVADGRSGRINDKHSLGGQSDEGTAEDSGGGLAGYSILSGSDAQIWSTSGPLPLSSELSDNGASGNPVSAPVSEDKLSATVLSVPLGTTSEVSPTIDSQTESTATENNDGQTPLADATADSIASPQVSADAQWNESAWEPSTSFAGYNTWITATLDEPSSSGVTIVPIWTFTKGSATSSRTDSALPSLSIISSSEDISTARPSPSITSQSTTGTEVSIPRVVHVNGINQAERTGTIIGVTVGVAVIVLLIVLTVFAYVRGGAVRGSFSNRKASLRNQIAPNPARNPETTEVSRDIERGMMNNEESRVTVDRRDTTSSNSQQDDVQWLEAWCRDKEKMTVTRQPPALRFNPELPLPPILLDDASRRSSAMSS